MTHTLVRSSLALTFLFAPLSEKIMAATIQVNLSSSQSVSATYADGHTYSCTKHFAGSQFPEIGCVEDGDNGITRSELYEGPLVFDGSLSTKLGAPSAKASPFDLITQDSGRYTYQAELTPQYAGDKFQFLLQETDKCLASGTICPSPTLSVTGAQSIHGDLATGELITARNPVLISLVGQTYLNLSSVGQSEDVSSSLTLTLLSENHPKKGHEQETDAAVTPEPATVALSALAIPLLWLWRKRKACHS